MISNRVLGVLALSVLVASCSLIAPAVAYSSSASSGSNIPIHINYIIHDGDDVIAFTSITNDPSDVKTYSLIKDDRETGYPSATITSMPNPRYDSNIVDKDQRFNIDVVIPAGVWYCIKVNVTKVLVSNNITISSPDFEGKFTLDSGRNATAFFGEENGVLIQKDAISDEVWIHSDKETTIHLEGMRGSTGIFDQNWGAVKVQIIMKITE